MESASNLAREAGIASAFAPARFPPQLRGVEEKLRRAWEHQEALKDETEAFLAAPPYAVSAAHDGEFQMLTATVTMQPPARLAIILGDLLYNLRSALDHLTWQFALASTPNPDRLTDFPIFDTPKAFKKHAHIKDVPEDVRLLLEGMQPYHVEWSILGQIGQELVALRNMSNQDKHRSLHITTALVEPKYVEHNAREGEDSGVRFTGSPDRQRSTIRMPRGARGHFEAAATILDDELPWRSGLEGIGTYLIHATEAAIYAFRPVFPLLRPTD